MLHLPTSVKVTHQGKNFTVSLPFKTLNINFTGELCMSTFVVY